MPPEHQYVIRNLWNSVTDAQNAVPILKAQIDAHTTSIAANTTAINNNNTASQTVIPSSPLTIGFVNDQTGNTSYTTLPSDYGSCIVLNDASPIAVTLTAETTIQLPWYASFLNFGTGTATLTPASGNISYPGNLAAASMPVATGQIGFVWFDGINFQADVLSLSSGGTITGVTAGTGLTGGGSSGTVTLGLATPVSIADGGTGTASPGLVAGSGISVTGSWPDQTIAATGGGGGGGYLEGAVSIPFAGNTSGTFSGTTTLAGAAVGMAAVVGDLAGIDAFIQWACYVSAPNTVTLAGTLPGGSVHYNTANYPVVVFSSGGGGSGVSSLNALTGALSLTSTGSTVTITPSGSTVDLEVAARYPTVVSSALSTTGMSSTHTYTFSSLAVGAYRIGFYFVVTTASAGPSILAQLGFTDSYASETLTMFTGAVVVGTMISETATFYNATSSGTATLTVTPDGTVTYIPQAIALERLA